MIQTVQQFIDSYKGKRKEKKAAALSEIHIWDDTALYGFVIKGLEVSGNYDEEEIRDIVGALAYSMALHDPTIDEAEEAYNKWADKEENDPYLPEIYIR